MPELPEVETVRRTLSPAVGATVTGLWTSGLPLHLGRTIDVAELRRAALGARLESVRRCGKYLLLDFEDRDRVVLVHLGMSGRFRLAPARSARPAHTHAVLRLQYPDGRRGELRLSDPRRFGLVASARREREREHPSLAGLGVDPLEDGLDGDTLFSATRGSRRPIKAALVDQRIVAGVGNIYASEALWRARIHPETESGRLSRARCAALAEAIVAALEGALTRGGTSLRDFVAADGAAGENADYLWVYGRAGAACPRERCRGTVARSVLQGRATFACTGCQRRPRARAGERRRARG